jgi:hypothetical protein
VTDDPSGFFEFSDFIFRISLGFLRVLRAVITYYYRALRGEKKTDFVSRKPNEKPHGSMDGHNPETRPSPKVSESASLAA